MIPATHKARHRDARAQAAIEHLPGEDGGCESQAVRLEGELAVACIMPLMPADATARWSSPACCPGGPTHQQLAAAQPFVAQR